MDPDSWAAYLHSLLMDFCIWDSRERSQSSMFPSTFTGALSGTTSSADPETALIAVIFFLSVLSKSTCCNAHQRS